MRRLKSKERKNGMKYCSFCKPDKVLALYRNQYLNPDNQKVQLACDKHKNLLVDGTHKSIDREKVLSKPEHFTEADYQTWLRL